MEVTLVLQIPTYGIFENINSLSQLAALPLWTEERPLRVVTGYTYVSYFPRHICLSLCAVSCLLKYTPVAMFCAIF